MFEFLYYTPSIFPHLGMIKKNGNYIKNDKLQKSVPPEILFKNDVFKKRYLIFYI